MPDTAQQALDLHAKHPGKIALDVVTPITSRNDLALAYSPGVAEPCKKIAENVDDVWKYTARRNLVAVVSDGSAVLGLGNIGPEAGLPVMEGKAVLFKEFGGVDAFPIVLNTQDTEEIIQIVKALEPTFGGINLEDIAAPRCFEIEERLRKEMNIPVFHDDQHGTAIVTTAGLINAAKITGRTLDSLRVVISGAGAAGVAIANMLLVSGVQHIIACDSNGILSSTRNDLNESKQRLRSVTNPENINGSLADALNGADVFIGVSAPGIVTQDMVRSMNENPIIFAMANPIPEIMPDEAREAGAAVVGTGRSDFPNQINNVLAFPGVFRGALDVAATDITDDMKLAAAHALADAVHNPSADNVIPDALDKSVASIVADAVKKAAV